MGRHFCRYQSKKSKTKTKTFAFVKQYDQLVLDFSITFECERYSKIERISKTFSMHIPNTRDITNHKQASTRALTYNYVSALVSTLTLASFLSSSLTIYVTHICLDKPSGCIKYLISFTILFSFNISHMKLANVLCRHCCQNYLPVRLLWERKSKIRTSAKQSEAQ